MHGAGSLSSNDESNGALHHSLLHQVRMFFFPIICWLIRFVRCQEARTFKTLESFFCLKLWVGPSGNASATIEKPHVFFVFDSDFSCARPRGEPKNSKEPRIKRSFSRCLFIGLTGIPFFLRLLMLVVSITVRREKLLRKADLPSLCPFS